MACLGDDHALGVTTTSSSYTAPVDKRGVCLGLDFPINKTDGWEVTGPGFRIDSSEFRRKRSRETLTSRIFMISKILE